MVKQTQQNAGGDDTLKKTDATTQAAEGSREEQDSLKAKLIEKEKEAAENYDRYVRSVAELDNYKKRSAREKTDLVKYGNENLLRDILPMIDNLERALKHAEKSNDFEAFKTGLDMLKTQLVCTLGKHGLEPIECANQPFDPNFHEAMLQVESGAHTDNQIVDELEKGYLLHGRLLRPAKVTVCKNKETQNCV